MYCIGDLTPYNPLEVVAALILLASQFVFLSDIVGCLIPILSSKLRPTSEFQKQRHVLRKYTEKECFADNTRLEAERYIKHMWQRQLCLDESALLGSMPRHLRLEVKAHICLQLLKQVRNGQVFVLVCNLTLWYVGVCGIRA